MSYPRKLHILIIEDEQDPIDTYRELLQAFQTEYSSVEPTVVHSYDAARKFLDSPNIFHVVILDLNLPLANRQTAPEGIEPGKELLELIAQRNSYPVPVALVISGRLNMACLRDLRVRLGKDFWYGEMINKGYELTQELKKGLQKAQEYCDVGIHLRDAGTAWFPTLSPREEDMLRRCALAQTNCLGLDLQWWGAEEGPLPSSPSSDPSLTKVLMGRFILDDGMGISRPTFFKFEPIANAEFACRDAGILNQKLIHVKVLHSAKSRSRCLLVTQCVTDGVPIPLGVYLRGDANIVQQVIPRLLDDVTNQLECLSPASDIQQPVNALLWRWHDREKIETAWNRVNRSIPIYGSLSLLEVFDSLRQNSSLVWISRRNCTHGDLNATNIAVESVPQGQPRAFIFDAAGIHADSDTRDLAVLEVTTLLFDESEESDKHFSDYKVFYADEISPGALPDIDKLPGVVRNTLTLLSAIRAHVQKSPYPKIYPLMVFDTVLQQLGGLTIQPSRNKIVNPERVYHLASWTASWLTRITPELISSD